jgi:type IX secretion system PorP/SprF family membrane protein
MKRFILTLCAGLASWNTMAQDLHFSQILQSPQLLNPGAVGVYDGWERAVIHHRNQWLGANTQFMSTSIAADVTFFKNPRRNTAYIGTGLSFYNDIGGDAKMGNQTAAFTLSGILPMGNSGQLSIGIQGGFGSRKGDMSKLLYDSQWTGSGFDPTIVSGEGDALNSFTYLDASTGVFYQFDGGSSSFARNNEMKLQIGIAAYHVNAPQMKYRAGSTEALARKYVGMINYTMDIPSSSWSYDLQFAQFIQGGHYETIFGGFIRKRFREGTKQTGFSHDASFGFGSYFRLKDAFVPMVQVDYGGFRFGLSYDVVVSAMRKAYSGGSIELSVSYTNIHDALFKGRRKSF